MLELIFVGLMLLGIALLVFEIALQLREVDPEATIKVIPRKVG